MFDFIGYLFLLVAGHLVADGPLQTGEMSIAKRPGGNAAVPWYLALAGHGFIHGGMVALITGCWPIGVLELVTHAAIDAGKCRRLYGTVADQALHVACKVLWAALIVTYA